MLKTYASAFTLRQHWTPSFRVVNLASCLLLSLSIMILASSYGNHGGWVTGSDGKPVQTDFMNFYSAGMLAQRGTPEDAYVWDRQREAQQELTGRNDTKFLPWPYPPIALPAAQLLAIPSYEISFLLFAAASLALSAAAASLIVGSSSAGLWVAGSSLAFCNVSIGQNGLMTAGLFGLGLYLLSTRPIMAGIVFGMLAFKPHLGLLLPLFLITLGAWRAFASATVTTLAAIAVSLAVYGSEAWLAFIHQLQRVGDHSMGLGSAIIDKLQSVYALLVRLGIGTDAAMAAHVAAAVAAVAAATWVWRSDRSYALKAASLLTATALISPYVFIYDLALLLIAQAFLIRHLLDRDGDLSSRMWLAQLSLSLMILGYIAFGWPMGLFATAMLGAMLITAARGERFAVRPPAPAVSAGSPS